MRHIRGVPGLLGPDNHLTGSMHPRERSVRWAVKRAVLDIYCQETALHEYFQVTIQPGLSGKKLPSSGYKKVIADKSWKLRQHLQRDLDIFLEILVYISGRQSRDLPLPATHRDGWFAFQSKGLSISLSGRRGRWARRSYMNSKFHHFKVSLPLV